MPRSENPEQVIHGCVRAARRVVAAISTPPYIRTPVGIAAGTCAITIIPNPSTTPLHNSAPIATATDTCAPITTPNTSTVAAWPHGDHLNLTADGAIKWKAHRRTRRLGGSCPELA